MNDANGFDILLRLVKILAARKRMILLFTFCTTVAAIIFVLVVESSYKAAGLVKPPRSESGSPIESMMREAGGGMAASLLGSFIGGDEEGLNDCLGILNSTRFARLVIDKFDLETRYKFKRKGKTSKYFYANVLKEFRERAEYTVTDENALMISMEDKSPETARDMVQFMIRALDSIYIAMQRTVTRQKLEYIDQRLTMAETDMKALEDSVVAFQKRNNLFLPEVQVQFILENAAQTEVQIESLKEEMALEGALRGTSSSRYRDLKVQRRLLEKTMLGKMRDRVDSNSLVHPATTLPTLATEYFRLERAYKIKLGLYKYLVEQVEALKLDADKNINVLTTIDPPWVNDKRVSPKRRIIVQAVFILSLLLSSLLAVILALWDKRKADRPELGAMLQDVRRSLFRL